MGCGAKSDILSKPLLSLVLFCLPVIAIVASGYGHVSRGWRTAIWERRVSQCHALHANALLRHRYFLSVNGTWRLFLYGTGVIDLGTNGWNLIGITILIGAIILTCLPEFLFGKYRRN